MAREPNEGLGKESSRFNDPEALDMVVSSFLTRVSAGETERSGDFWSTGLLFLGASLDLSDRAGVTGGTGGRVSTVLGPLVDLGMAWILDKDSELLSKVGFSVEVERFARDSVLRGEDGVSLVSGFAGTAGAEADLMG